MDDPELDGLNNPEADRSPPNADYRGFIPGDPIYPFEPHQSSRPRTWKQLFTWTIVKHFVNRNLSVLSMVLIAMPVLLSAISYTQSGSSFIQAITEDMQLAPVLAKYEAVFRLSYFGAILIIIARLIYQMFAPTDIKRFSHIDEFLNHYSDMESRGLATQDRELIIYARSKINAHWGDISFPPRRHCAYVWADLSRKNSRLSALALSGFGSAMLLSSPIAVFIDVSKSVLF